MLFVVSLCGIVVSMSDHYQELPCSVPGYTLQIVLERDALNLMKTIG